MSLLVSSLLKIHISSESVSVVCVYLEIARIAVLLVLNFLLAQLLSFGLKA